MARKKKKKDTKKSEAPVANISSRYRFFLWMCSFFALAGLFIGLDVMTIWPGAEAYSLDLALSNERASYLPAYLNSLLIEPGAALFEKADLFFLFPRILSAFFMIATAVLFYRWGQPLFGKTTVQLQLLLLAASLWLPFHGKVATADSLLLFSHVGLWLSLIFVIRSGLLRYQLYAGVFALVGGIIAPVSTLVLVVLLSLSFIKRISLQDIVKRAWPAFLTPLVGFLSAPSTDWTYFGLSSQHLLFAVLGTLPFIGFAVAGMRDAIYKFLKGEELALIYLGLLVAGLVSGSPLFAFGLCLIAGKQLQLYFSPGYPWNNWVRGPAILHLIFALIGCFLLLMGGFITFRGDGYRAFLGMIAAYWIFSLFGVLGIYGMRRDFTIGGVVLSGILATLFFWVQVYPYYETERNWPSEFVSQYNKLDYRSSKVGFEKENPVTTSNLKPYLRRAGIEMTSENDATLVLQSLPADTTKYQAPINIEGRSWFQLHRFVAKPAN